MSNRPTGRPYDQIDVAEDMLPRQHLNYAATMTLVGTAAAAGTKITDLFILPANTNIKVSAASIKRSVGGTGTSTSPNWGLGYSLAGTGAFTCFGTLLFGTVADNTYSNFSVTETRVAAGDVLQLYVLTGTKSGAEETATFLSVEYKEDWT